jgi:hypothetical protein
MAAKTILMAVAQKNHVIAKGGSGRPTVHRQTRVNAHIVAANGWTSGSRRIVLVLERAATVAQRRRAAAPPHGNFRSISMAHSIGICFVINAPDAKSGSPMPRPPQIHAINTFALMA